MIKHAWRTMVVLATLGVASVAGAGYINHDFTTGFTLGQTFTVPCLQWQASTSSVLVVNTAYATASNSVKLSEASVFSNSVAAIGPTEVWTDYRLVPLLGAAPASIITNGVAIVQYFSTNGYLMVWNGSAWLTCSNDVWGNAVTRLTNGVFATLAIHQNFTSQRAAILVNDQVVLQDFPFSASLAHYNYFAVVNAAGEAHLDDVYINPAYDSARYAQDRNLNGETDGYEIDTYGYVARTFLVGTGRPYTSLAAALLVARDRDTLDVDCFAYNEAVVVTQNLTIVGCTFTNSGSITVAAGKTLTAQVGFTSALSVSGTLAIGAGVVVSGATVAVSGTGSITVGPDPTAQLLAGSLTIGVGGTVASTAAHVLANGTDLTGTFVLDSTWGSQATASLAFVDTFELYSANTLVQTLGFRGWGASASGVQVKSGAGVSGSKAVIVPEGTTLSNRINAVAHNKVWTDYHVRPQPGSVPPAIDTSTTALTSYVTTNGWLAIWNGGAWMLCSNYLDGTAAVAITNSGFARLSVFLNYTTDSGAVFLGGKLLRELVPFPGGAGVPSYRNLEVQNTAGNAWLDNVTISTNVPSGLNTDLDGDGVEDGYEIDTYNSLLVWNGPRTVFLFR